jgi:hypothetical protein
MAHTWPAITPDSLLFTFYSLLFTFYSLLITFYSLLITFYFLLGAWRLALRAITPYLRALLALLLTSAPPVRVVMLGELSSPTGCYPHVTLAQMVGDHAELGLLYNM